MLLEIAELAVGSAGPEFGCFVCIPEPESQVSDGGCDEKNLFHLGNRLSLKHDAKLGMEIQKRQKSDE